jgi:CheY-like chemotaxis protein
MEPETLSRIFEPFFTTKPAGAGTGVGLSVCRGIVAAHGGTIEAESSEGQGARFTVMLPLGEESLGQPSSETTDSGSRSTAARILVVDDEPDLAEMVAEMLRRDGHEARVISSADAALGAVREGSVDLVVSDIRMPGLDGPGLYRALVKARPTLTDRILFVTGDTLSSEIQSFIHSTGVPVVEKPIDPLSLRRAVAERLNGEARPRPDLP